MIHCLALGHFESEPLLSSGFIIVRRPLDMSMIYDLLNSRGYQDEAIGFAINGQEVEIQDGYIVCPWLSAGANAESVDFMLAIHSLTDCMFVDVTTSQLVEVDELRESVNS